MGWHWLPAEGDAGAVEASDGELAGLARAGDAEAFGKLVARYQGHVYGLAYSLVDNWAEAQDIAQEAFIRAYVSLYQLREPERFAAWLRRVAFSVTMNWLKAHRPGLFGQLNGRVGLDTLEVPDFRPGPPEMVEKRELARAVQRAVAALPPKYRLPLTMFHLNGLSYQKVAEFLDIPLGTAKSLIHRARGKLKQALATYVAEKGGPMVQEVFEEHKLPAEFGRRVLESIPRLAWEKGEYTLAGAVVACMEFLREDVSYEFVTGVSGGAFELLWHPDWRPAKGDLALLSEEPIRRTFQALGYRYQYFRRTGEQEGGEEFRRLVMRSIEEGRPVIAFGVVGPPEACVVAGYEEDGEVLLGHSYFHDGCKGYYRKSDWYDECSGLILVGEKQRPPSRGEILRDALRWGVEVARTRKRGEYITGLGAYDAWAAALRRDEDFPAGDVAVLAQRCNISNSIVLAGLWDARRAAADFLRGMAAVAGCAGHRLLDAARAYGDEFRILDSAMQVAPFCGSPEESRLRMADPALRGRLADLILGAKKKEEQALSLIEGALKDIKAG
jgi:RNA polymerase sigma factor (sigma-70 family)